MDKSLEFRFVSVLYHGRCSSSENLLGGSETFAAGLLKRCEAFHFIMILAIWASFEAL